MEKHSQKPGKIIPWFGVPDWARIEKASWVLGTHSFLLLTVDVKGLCASNSNPDFSEVMMDYNLNLKDKNNSFLP